MTISYIKKANKTASSDEVETRQKSSGSSQ